MSTTPRKARALTQKGDAYREPFTFTVTFECDPTVARSAHYLLTQALTSTAWKLGLPTSTSDILPHTTQ